MLLNLPGNPFSIKLKDTKAHEKFAACKKHVVKVCIENKCSLVNNVFLSESLGHFLRIGRIT